MRTVIYARFSSDNQNPLSTADQVALCRERADREGWTVVAVFEDDAISGNAGMGEDQRPGMAAMLQLVEAGGVDQVLTESTSRVARHLADATLIRERIEHAGARLFTLADGVVTPIIGFVKGFVDQQQRTDLAAAVKRGQRGAIRRGRAASGLAYGYRIANRIDERGRYVAGLREIDPEKAAIILRIFTEIDAGRSARSIAMDLNAEGVPASRGTHWLPSAILGHAKTGFGILRNPIYIGKLVYGRTKTVVNPITRRKRMRPNTDETPIVGDAPELRIVPQDLWDRVQARLAEAATDRPERQRRPKHLLSGLGVCDVCGGPFVKRTGENWGCARALNRACSNNRMISTRRYEQSVIDDLKAGLLAPDAAAAYAREYRLGMARAAAEADRDRQRLQRRLGEATRKVDRLLDAFANGGREFTEIRDMLGAARAEKESLARELASLDALPRVLELHPGLEDQYRREVEDLHAALSAPESRLEAIPRFRAMIARIIVRPHPTKARGVQLEVVRQMDEILSIATGAELKRKHG